MPWWDSAEPWKYGFHKHLWIIQKLFKVENGGYTQAASQSVQIQHQMALD